MVELQRGGNAPVEGNRAVVRVDWAGPPGLEADISAYLLGESGKVSGDHDMIFYNQPSGGGGAVTLSAGAGSSTFSVDLARLPAQIARITFCLTIDEAQARGHRFAMLSRADVSVTGGADIRFVVPREGASEAAMILGELYRRQGAWKFRAVGQGFDGGLGPLARSFGIQVDDEPAAAPPPPAPAQSPFAAPPAASPFSAPAPPPPPNLVKPPPVILTKPNQSERVSLAKSGGGKLMVSATWVDNGDASDDNDDLDLRVGLLLPNGQFRMIWAPGEVGAYDRAPFVRHLGDVRKASLTEPGTEKVEVNPRIARELGGRVALVFSVYSAVSNGIVSVPSLRPRMRMECGDQVVECAFDFMSKRLEDEDFIYTYVLGTALIDGDTIELRPSGLTSEPASEETPRLSWRPDGGIDVTVDGPELFK